MPHVGLERLDPLVPEPQHARPQRLGGPLVVEPHVGGRAPGLVVGLCGDAGPRVRLRHPPLPGEPPEADLLGRPDDDDEVVLRRHRLLDDEGHVVHDDRVDVRLRDELGGAGPDRRVRDALEVAQGCRVPEH